MPKFSEQAIWKKPEVRRLLFIALFAEIGYAVLNISSMPVYLKFDRQLSTSVIGIVLTAFLLSEALFKSFMGSLADQIGRKKLITYGPLLTVFTSLATLIVPYNAGYLETILILILRIFDGIGAAMLWPAAFALMSDTVEEKDHQQGMSLLNVCYLVGIALALPFGGILNDLTGEREASFFLAAFLFLMATALAAKTLPRVSPQGPRLHPEPNVENKFMFLNDLVTATKKIPGFLFLAFLTFMAVGFPMAIIKLFAEQQFHASESAFGLIALPSTIAMALLSVTMSKIGQKIGVARAVHVGLGLCAIGISIISVGAFHPAMRSLTMLAVGGLPVGIGFLLAIPAWYTSVSQMDEGTRAANIGAVMTAQGLGTIIGAPLGATFYDKLQIFGADFGRYSPFLGCAACMIISFLLSLKILKR